MAEADVKIGVRQVREACRAQGNEWFRASAIADELDVDEQDVAGMKSIWKALQFLERKHELQKQRDSKVSRWRVLTLREDEERPKFQSMKLEHALLAWGRPRR